MVDWLYSPQTLGLAFAAVLGAFATVIFNWFAEARPKIVVATTHQFTFALAPQAVLTRTIIIQNLGRARVDWVEIVHSIRPAYFQLFPALHYVETITAEGHHLIRINSLAGKEFFYVAAITPANQPPELLYVRTPLGHAQAIPIGSRRILPWWQTLLLRSLFVGGAVFWFAIVIKAIEIAYRLSAIGTSR